MFFYKALLVILAFVILTSSVDAKKKGKKSRTNTLSTKTDITSLKEELKSMKKEIETCLDSKGPKLTPDCTGQENGMTKIITRSGWQFQAMCKDDWLLMANRFDGSVDFYLNWKEYKHGFGSSLAEHFIGFDNLLSVLREGQYKLRIEMTTWENETRYAEYAIFDIGAETDKWRLTVGNYSGTAGDALSRHNAMFFSTPDRDHDLDAGNCAVRHKGPWWNFNCALTRLFNKYNNGPLCDTRDNCIHWDTWPLIPGKTADWYSFKAIQMKIHPV